MCLSSFEKGMLKNVSFRVLGVCEGCFFNFSIVVFGILVICQSLNIFFHSVPCI